MTLRLLPGFGDPIYEVTAPENITLPSGFAPGRQITYRRTDAGSGTVSVQATGGDVLNGSANGSTSIPAGGTAVFRSVDPGQWRATGVTTGGVQVVNADGSRGSKSVVVKLSANGNDIDDIQVGS